MVNFRPRVTTELGAFHAPGGVLAAAVAKVPGYTAASEAYTAALERLTAYMAALPSPQTSPVTAVLAALASDDPLPATLAADLHDAQGAEARYRSLAVAAEEAVRTLSARRDQAVAAGREVVMRHIDGVMREAVKEARRVDLGGARDAESAIRCGRGEEWTRLADLRATYRAARDAQSTTWAKLFTDHSQGGGVNSSLFGTFGAVENLAEVIGEAWYDMSRARGQEFAQGRFEETFGSTVWPWLAEKNDAGTADAMFAWLLSTPAAIPWAPTPEQARAAHASALAAIREGRPAPNLTPDPKQTRAIDSARAAAERAAEARKTALAGGVFGDW